MAKYGKETGNSPLPARFLLNTLAVLIGKGKGNRIRHTMKKGAVIIGVDKTGDLPILNAAGSGAIDFSNWANQQGFDVTLLVDANDRPVTVADISNAINRYVQPQTYSQLIVYFSGHGILRSPDYELWLLSGSPANPNEAVNLSGSISRIFRTFGDSVPLGDVLFLFFPSAFVGLSAGQRPGPATHRLPDQHRHSSPLSPMRSQ